MNMEECHMKKFLHVYMQNEADLCNQQVFAIDNIKTLPNMPQPA